MAKNSSGNVLHFGSIRLHVNGSGNLKTRFLSLDEIYEKELTDLVMANPNSVKKTRLINFTQQGAQLEIKTLAIDEWFRIQQVIIFVKSVASEYPN